MRKGGEGVGLGHDGGREGGCGWEGCTQFPPDDADAPTVFAELCSAENVTAQSVAMTRGLAAAVVEAEEKAVEEAKKAEEEAKRAAEEARTAAEEATTADTADEDSTAEADGENEKSADEREEGEDADVKNEDDGGTVPAERQEL